MASRFVVCKDREEACKYYDAGMLYLNMMTGSSPSWKLALDAHPVETYGKWPWDNSNDFACLVEEDDTV